MFYDFHSVECNDKSWSWINVEHLIGLTAAEYLTFDLLIYFLLTWKDFKLRLWLLWLKVICCAWEAVLWPLRACGE